MLFSKRKESDSRKRSIDFLQTQNKENLEDFILILEQIQELNNEKAAGKGSFFKNYKQKQINIDNAISLALESIKKKLWN